MMSTVGRICGALLFLLVSSVVHAAKQPNVIWIWIDDQHPWYGAYGDSTVPTPNIDALAQSGVVFERAYVATPVCAPSRSALVTGSYPIRLGTHDMRSSRVPEYQIHLPEDTLTVPELLRQAGYETFNNGKDDYNFVYDRETLYSLGNPSGTWSYKGPRGGGDWTDVRAGVPFFGQYQLTGGKTKGPRALELLAEMDARDLTSEDVSVPPQYPDIPGVRRAIVDHYQSIQLTDQALGEFVARLRADGHWENTVLMFFSDHGSDLPRSKEFCYEEGLQVPLIVVAPGLQDVVRPGSRRTEPVALMDVAATTLALAGLDVPAYMDAKNLFAGEYRREFVFSSQDRMSNTIDRVRSVMGERYHYIRNFMTDRPLMQWGHREMVAAASIDKPGGAAAPGGLGYFMTIRRMYEKGELTPAQAAPYGPRLSEELYDLEQDPNEVVNLAGSAEHAMVLTRMREALDGWVAATDDQGQYPRSLAALREVTERYPADWLKAPEFDGLKKHEVIQKK
jgi:arylsulfatase A-like enzyme